MRIALSALLLVLLALTALAGTGCKRHPGGAGAQAPSFSRMSHQVQAHPMVAHRSEASQLAFVFCHPSAELDESTISAAEAQVVFDLKANNDDRTEMIAADFERPEVPALPQAQVAAGRLGRASGWLSVLDRPPRTALLRA